MSDPGTGVPSACGALGNFDPAAVARLAAGFSNGLGEVHRDACSALHLDREPVTWVGSGSERGLAWNERLPGETGRARDVRQAAAAGAWSLVVDGERRALCASAAGALPVYAILAGDAAYFSTAIDPLARAGIVKPSPDWETWASILALGFPPGAATPFAEIVRLEPNSALESAPERAPSLRPGGLSWVDVEPEPGFEAAEGVVSAMRNEVAALTAEGPVLCPLSGGHDSRLLLCLLAEREELEASAWTIGDDWHPGYEERLAGPVATALEVPHTVVDPEPRPFADELLETAALLEHQSILRFAFLARLERALPRQHPVVDGLAGGFVKGDWGFADLVEGSDSRRGAGALFDRFAPPESGLHLFRADVWEAVRSSAAEAWMREAERFAGHPAAMQLLVYWTRIRRRIGPSPTRIFGAEHQVAMPFVADEAVRAALRAPLEEKRNGRLYRQVFELVAPEVGALPSTNDGTRPRTRVAGRAGSDAALATYASLLERSPLEPAFGDLLQQALERRRLGRIGSSYWLLERVQSLCNLTIWLTRYGDILDGPEPGGPLDSGASGA